MSTLVNFGSADSGLDGQFSVGANTQRPAAARKAPDFAQLVAGGLMEATPTANSGTVRFIGGGPGLRAARFNVAGVARAYAVLRSNAALTIVDAPALDGCGALLLDADAVLVVADSRHTSPIVIRRAIESAQLDQSRIAGVLLNYASARRA
ncbi:hypothetical protein WKW79_36040 [Variovorax robiniae]|uniref:Uncharacterized protein n=1 Tax=Variovorax robiniae TaxID=1836199 RepID=A0ABU8XMS9_9BURK